MGVYEHRLTATVEHFGRPVTRVFLLEPRASHLSRYGEPQMPVFSSRTGTAYDVVNEDAVAKYLDELLSLDGKNPVDGGGRVLFALLSLQDGIALRDELFGFFVKAKLSLISARSTPSSTT